MSWKRILSFVLSPLDGTAAGLVVGAVAEPCVRPSRRVGSRIWTDGTVCSSALARRWRSLPPPSSCLSVPLAGSINHQGGAVCGDPLGSGRAVSVMNTLSSCTR